MTLPLRDDPFYSDLFEIFRGIKKLGTALAEDFGLSISHVVTLRALSCKGSCTMSELTDHLKVTHGAATGTIDRLEREGFVTRTHSPSDRRVVEVSITAAGAELLDRLEQSACDSFDLLIQPLPDADRASIIAGVAKLAHLFRSTAIREPQRTHST
ncbi:MAG: MarR family transcriptional regulator [Cyanobacteria bacterium REEB65]|nr:MarR family transcriptional regulator [Cyanobacteria bacterium REEB65]